MSQTVLGKKKSEHHLEEEKFLSENNNQNKEPYHAFVMKQHRWGSSNTSKQLWGRGWSYLSAYQNEQECK